MCRNLLTCGNNPQLASPKASEEGSTQSLHGDNDVDTIYLSNKRQAITNTQFSYPYTTRMLVPVYTMDFNGGAEPDHHFYLGRTFWFYLAICC